MQDTYTTTSASATAATAVDKNAKPTVEDSNLKKRPLMTKSAVCRLLAELVKSYGSCAKLITDHVYESGLSDLIKEDTTALAFMLDELLIGSASSDKESSQLVKTLIAALSSCNHYPDAQTTLVSEVKSALARALALHESNLKHTKIQALTGLILTMIESCPSSQSHQSTLAAYKQHQYNMNNIVKIMLKRGLVTDLARVAHSLDLSSPNVSATINAVLKPLETLSRIVNQPSPLATTR
jgi:E3 ubiquitin-protein ligase HUWE1